MQGVSPELGMQHIADNVTQVSLGEPIAKKAVDRLLSFFNGAAHSASCFIFNRIGSF